MTNKMSDIYHSAALGTDLTKSEIQTLRRATRIIAKIQSTMPNGTPLHQSVWQYLQDTGTGIDKVILYHCAGYEP